MYINHSLNCFRLVATLLLSSQVFAQDDFSDENQVNKITVSGVVTNSDLENPYQVPT